LKANIIKSLLFYIWEFLIPQLIKEFFDRIRESYYIEMDGYNGGAVPPPIIFEYISGTIPGHRDIFKARLNIIKKPIKRAMDRLIEATYLNFASVTKNAKENSGMATKKPSKNMPTEKITIQPIILITIFGSALSSLILSLFFGIISLIRIEIKNNSVGIAIVTGMILNRLLYPKLPNRRINTNKVRNRVNIK